MARPCKSAKVLSDCSQTKEEIEKRVQYEEKLKGKSNKIRPPTYLTSAQKKIFKYIVSELTESEILGNLDIYILTTCAICIDRLQEIEKLINQDFEMIFVKGTMAAREKYSKDFSFFVFI